MTTLDTQVNNIDLIIDDEDVSMVGKNQCQFFFEELKEETLKEFSDEKADESNTTFCPKLVFF